MSETSELRLERTFAAPPQAVFEAWTNPLVLRRWWAAGRAWETPRAEVDLRVGGRYRLSMRDPKAGVVHTVGGVYREIRRPERLVYTWRWEDAETPAESLVCVDFVAVERGTTVILHHTGLPSGQQRDQHRAGWSGCLENLELRVLAGAPVPP
jgi:uncharacterized protein YndB with AHSA1/START domain